MSVKVSVDYDNTFEIKQKAFKYKGAYYVLQEASEAAAVAYRNAMIACATGFNPDTGKPTGVSGLASPEPQLVCDCLFLGKAQENDLVEMTSSKVGLETLNTWPGRMVNEMYEWVKDNSDLHSESPEEQLAGLKKQVAKLEKEVEDRKKSSTDMAQK